MPNEPFLVKFWQPDSKSCVIIVSIHVSDPWSSTKLHADEPINRAYVRPSKWINAGIVLLFPGIPVTINTRCESKCEFSYPSQNFRLHEYGCGVISLFCMLNHHYIFKYELPFIPFPMVWYGVLPCNSLMVKKIYI